MNEKTAWENFVKNGLVSDYLKYRDIVNRERGVEIESIDRRSDNKSK